MEEEKSRGEEIEGEEWMEHEEALRRIVRSAEQGWRDGQFWKRQRTVEWLAGLTQRLGDESCRGARRRMLTRLMRHALASLDVEAVREALQGRWGAPFWALLAPPSLAVALRKASPAMVAHWTRVSGSVEAAHVAWLSGSIRRLLAPDEEPATKVELLGLLTDLAGRWPMRRWFHAVAQDVCLVEQLEESSSSAELLEATRTWVDLMDYAVDIGQGTELDDAERQAEHSRRIDAFQSLLYDVRGDEYRDVVFADSSAFESRLSVRALLQNLDEDTMDALLERGGFRLGAASDRPELARRALERSLVRPSHPAAWARRQGAYPSETAPSRSEGRDVFHKGSARQRLGWNELLLRAFQTEKADAERSVIAEVHESLRVAGVEMDGRWAGWHRRLRKVEHSRVESPPSKAVTMEVRLGSSHGLPKDVLWEWQNLPTGCFVFLIRVQCKTGEDRRLDWMRGGVVESVGEGGQWLRIRVDAWQYQLDAEQGHLAPYDHVHALLRHTERDPGVRPRLEFLHRRLVHPYASARPLEPWLENSLLGYPCLEPSPLSKSPGEVRWRMVVGGVGTGKTGLAAKLAAEVRKERALVVVATAGQAQAAAEALIRQGLLEHELVTLGAGRDAHWSPEASCARMESAWRQDLAQLQQIAQSRGLWPESVAMETAHALELIRLHSSEFFSDDEIETQTLSKRRLMETAQLAWLGSEADRKRHVVDHLARVVVATGTAVVQWAVQAARVPTPFARVLVDGLGELREAELLAALSLTRIQDVVVLADPLAVSPTLERDEPRAMDRLLATCLPKAVLTLRLAHIGVKAVHPWLARLYQSTSACMDSPSLGEPSWPLAGEDAEALKFVNVADSVSVYGQPPGESSPEAHSYQNLAEAAAVVDHALVLLHGGLPPRDLVLLTPYHGQAELLADLLRQRCGPPLDLPTVSTLDGFRGRRASVVLVSLVRTVRLGVLADPARVALALSRADRVLILFGCASLLSTDPFWSDFLSFLSNRK